MKSADKIHSQLILRKDDLPNSSQSANVNKLRTSCLSPLSPTTIFRLNPAAQSVLRPVKLFFWNLIAPLTNCFGFLLFVGNLQLRQLWQTCKMLYLQGRYLALSMTYSIQKFSLCVTCMLEWKSGSFQWMLTDCLQNQHVLEERLDSVKVQAAADGWKKLVPRKISAIPPRRKGEVEVEELLTMGLPGSHGPWRWNPPSQWEAVPICQQWLQCSRETTWEWTWLTGHFLRSIGERQTATSFIQSRQRRHDQVPRRAHD